MLDALLSSPKIMMLVCAVVITMISRFVSALHGAIQDTPDASRLQQTICVVSVVPPGCSTNRLVELMRWAQQASCIRLHIFEYVSRRAPGLAEKSASIRHRVRPERTYDARTSLAEAVQESYCDEAYICILPSNLSAVSSWDEELLRMHSECRSPGAALTTLLPAEQASQSDRANFLRVLPPSGESKEPRLASANFQGDVSAPVPQSLCCARFLFGGRELAAALLDVYDSEPRVRDLEMSQALWTRGIDFFAPSRAVLWSLPTCQPSRIGDARSHFAEDGAVRSKREYVAYSGVDAAAKQISARANLGLTAHASPYEMSAKYGTREDAEEVLAVHPANAIRV